MAPSSTTTYLDVINPATAVTLAKVPLSPASEIDKAAQRANDAFAGWQRVPATERIQYLFKLKALLEVNFEEIARTITIECGKTIDESRGELRRN